VVARIILPAPYPQRGEFSTTQIPLQFRCRRCIYVQLLFSALPWSLNAGTDPIPMEGRSRAQLALSA